VKDFCWAILGFTGGIGKKPDSSTKTENTSSLKESGLDESAKGFADV
jgi:hypothetical protein